MGDEGLEPEPCNDPMPRDDAMLKSRLPCRIGSLNLFPWNILLYGSTESY